MRGSQRPVPVASTRMDIARTAVGLIWLAGAAFNALETMRMPEPFTWLEASPVRPYTWFFRDVAGAQPVLWTTLLVVGETALGLLTLARGRTARVGLGLGALFSAFLFSLLTPYTMIMGAHAAALAWLATKEYPVSPVQRLWSFITRHERRAHGTGA